MNRTIVILSIIITTLALGIASLAGVQLLNGGSAPAHNDWDAKTVAVGTPGNLISVAKDTTLAKITFTRPAWAHHYTITGSATFTLETRNPVITIAGEAWATIDGVPTVQHMVNTYSQTRPQVYVVPTDTTGETDSPTVTVGAMVMVGGGRTVNQISTELAETIHWAA